MQSSTTTTTTTTITTIKNKTKQNRVWLDAINGFLAIFPDACLLIISIVTLILFKKDHNIIKSKNSFKSKRGINLPKNTRKTKIFVSLALMFFIAKASPCVGNLVFLVFGVLFFSIWSFGSLKIYDFKLYWALLFIYSVAYFLLIYIFQFPSFNVDIPDYIGVFYIFDPVIVVYLPIFRIIILFLTILSISSVLTDQFFGEDVHKKQPQRPTIKNQASIGRTSLFLFVLSICLLLFYVSWSPSLLTLPIWILCGISILFPKVFTFLISITSHYLILIFLAQYVFNIDFGFTSTDILSDLGFLFFEDPIITFGLGGLTVVFLCFHNRLINFLKKSSNISDNDQNLNSENEKLINNDSNLNDNKHSTSTDSLEEENEWLELDDIRDKDDDDDDDDDELKKKKKKK
ncbi:32 kda heat shock protein-related [Anaeramoeba flamelloides]|uniref:32 kDa heat shock protein-related n=1 Tax=Anaeramoeba flamelloides TaxID=1746091 RepID=A0ABQ8XTY1_9EUKA|nr:32 kda heat shock protein-related [Anaeramoeba flamelloides]